jgi:hypothetical protein
MRSMEDNTYIDKGRHWASTVASVIDRFVIHYKEVDQNKAVGQKMT